MKRLNKNRHIGVGIPDMAVFSEYCRNMRGARYLCGKIVVKQACVGKAVIIVMSDNDMVKYSAYTPEQRSEMARKAYAKRRAREEAAKQDAATSPPSVGTESIVKSDKSD